MANQPGATTILATHPDFDVVDVEYLYDLTTIRDVVGSRVAETLRRMRRTRPAIAPLAPAREVGRAYGPGVCVVTSPHAPPGGRPGRPGSTAEDGPVRVGGGGW